MPIICAGQIIFPGDVIVADDDGICVVARKNVPAARQAADERIANEDAKRVKLAAGELGIDIYNTRPALADAGFTMSRRLMILANLTALIAVTAIRAMPSQNRRSKTQRKDD